MLLIGACASNHPWTPATALDRGDVPDAVRPAYGNAKLHTWWPLTPAEIAAIGGIDRARSGDVHALLALAILASGDQRDAATYARLQQSVDQIIVALKPIIDAAPDDWHRGYELNRGMHRLAFNAHAELEGYQFDQARLSGIFSSGHYNCLSSAILFAVLARGFGLSVRGVLVPTHVFIEMNATAQRTIEVETTSSTGFDWVHDERFFRESASQWSSQRGLRPVTLDEYQHRTILQPYQLIAHGMRDPYVTNNQDDRARLYEVAALVDPDNVQFQQARIQYYAQESQNLYQAKAWRTLVKLFDTVGAAVSEIAARGADAKTLEMVSWINWFHAQALSIVGRQSEATTLMDQGLQHINPAWDDAAKLKNNYVSMLNDLLCGFIARNDYPGAISVFASHRAACRSDDICASNAAVAYLNQSIAYTNAGDWPSARKSLQDCAAQLPNDPRCPQSLADLQTRHQF